MNNLEREYRERVFSYFNQYSAAATAALKETFSREFAEEVVHINFAMFPYDCLGTPLPIFTWPTGKSNEVYADFECLLSKIPTDEFEYYDEEIEEYVGISWHLKDCAARWLRGAWKEAGGEFFRLPCLFIEHDDIES